MQAGVHAAAGRCHAGGTRWCRLTGHLAAGGPLMRSGEEARLLAVALRQAQSGAQASETLRAQSVQS